METIIIIFYLSPLLKIDLHLTLENKYGYIVKKKVLNVSYSNFSISHFTLNMYICCIVYEI